MSRTSTFISLIVAGCLIAGYLGSGTSGISAVSDSMRGKSYLRISFGGQEAKQNVLKKAAPGFSNWQVIDPVSSSNPVISYRITNLEKMKIITLTVINIFQGNYSAQPEFTVFPRGKEPDNLMKENAFYDLGNPPASLTVWDKNRKEVKGVKLIPGKKYMLQLSIQGDDSETAQIYFKTK